MSAFGEPLLEKSEAGLSRRGGTGLAFVFLLIGFGSGVLFTQMPWTGAAVPNSSMASQAPAAAAEAPPAAAQEPAVSMASFMPPARRAFTPVERANPFKASRAMPKSSPFKAASQPAKPLMASQPMKPLNAAPPALEAAPPAQPFESAEPMQRAQPLGASMPLMGEASLPMTSPLEAVPPAQDPRQNMLPPDETLEALLTQALEAHERKQQAETQKPKPHEAESPLKFKDPQPPTQLVSAWQHMQGERVEVGKAEINAVTAAVQSLQDKNSVPAAKLQASASAMHMAAKSGMQAGCKGQQVCERAVGHLFGTSTHTKDEVANIMGVAAGFKKDEIKAARPKDVEKYGGLIVDAEQKAPSKWDDYFQEMQAADLCGKPVQVFEAGMPITVASAAQNFCDAVKGLHSTFEQAGSKMLGHFEGGSGFFPLDEGSMPADKVKGWAGQLKQMPVPGL